MSSPKKDSADNYIGDGSFHASYSTINLEKYPSVSAKVSKSNTTETVYVEYHNKSNGKEVTVRFSNHQNNAVKFGDQLNGNLATDNEILHRLGLKKATFIPNKKLHIGRQFVPKKTLQNYEETNLTIDELFALGAGADISKHTGKLANGSNEVILGKTVNEHIQKRSNAFGQEVQLGRYEYSDIDTTINIEKLLRAEIRKELDGPDCKKLENLCAVLDTEQGFNAAEEWIFIQCATYGLAVQTAMSDYDSSLTE